MDSQWPIPHWMGLTQRHNGRMSQALSHLSRTPPSSFTAVVMAAATVALLTLPGCASTQTGKGATPTVNASPASPASGMQANAPSAAATTPPTATAPAFETVVKGADRQAGLLPLWKRQDKVWVELAPEDFGRAWFLSPKLRSGLGEGGFFGGLLASRWARVGKPQWVEFRRLNQQVQLVAVNAAYRARKDSPEALAVAAAFSPSLLASVPVASAAHPTRHTVLVELSALLTGDVLGLGLQLNQTFRQGYSLDARNTAITLARTTPTALLIDVQQHFAQGGLSLPTGTAAPQPVVPSALPDPRSLFLNLQYTLTPLPTQPAPVRVADPRVGFFATTIADFSNELARTPRVRLINRWQLAKRDPAAPLSPPMRPITYWLDRSIPTEYRDTIREGVLTWNQAFEAIGIQGALEVKDATADQPQDVVGKGQAVIRWMTNHRPNFGAIGPSHVDPRTGEILTSEIALESLSTRAIRTARSQVLGVQSQAPTDAPDASGHGWHRDQCQHAELAAEQLDYGLDWLAAQRELPPDSAEVKAFVLAYLKDTTMHEVGHTLGLRHNFRASRWRENAQLQQLALTSREGNSASVMDYTPINLGLPGLPWGAPFQTTLGPYDFWAIEYGYKPLIGDEAAQAQALKQIADRSADPTWQVALDYGTDEDNLLGLDPQALAFDLGRDPIAFATQRLAIAHGLIQQQTRVTLQPSDDAPLLRRRINYALRDLERTATVLGRQVGGLITRRDAPGSGRDLLDPLPFGSQRAALKLLTTRYLAPGAVSIPPGLQRRLAPDYQERGEGMEASGQPLATDFSVANQWLAVQRGVLNTLMADSLAERLLDNIDKTRDRQEAPLTLPELHRHLREAIWTDEGRDANPAWQRNVQREHVNRLATAVVRGSGRADVRAQLRQQARELMAQLQKPVSTRSMNRAPDSTAEAHRQDCLETLKRALSASVQRTTP